MESIYETTNGSTVVLLDNKNGFYIVQLIGKVSRTHYQAAFQTILEDSKKTNVSNLLLNIKDLTATPDPYRLWFTKFFLPKLSKNIKNTIHIAVVHPLKLIEKYTIPFFYEVLKIFGWNIEVRFFENLQKANQWLVTQQEKKCNNHSKYSQQYEEKEDKKENTSHFFDSREKKEENFNTQKKKNLKEKIEEGNFKIKKDEEKTTLQVGKKKSNFKIKVYFDKKGGFETQKLTDGIFPKINLFDWNIFKKNKTENTSNNNKQNKDS
jgi:hypothetical protein